MRAGLLETVNVLLLQIEILVHGSTGGEPLLRKDFIEILKYTAKKYNGRISLSTNATLINKENVKILSLLLSSIDISLDGTDEESCSLLRGPGVFNKVIENVKLLKENNFEKISLSMVLIDDNKHLEEQFKKLNGELGTKPLIRNFSPTGRGKANKENLIKDEKNNNEKIFSFSRDRLSVISKGLKCCSCGAGRNQLLINYDGSIYPCGLLIYDRLKLGNVNDISNLKDFLANIDSKSQAYEFLKQIQPDVFSKCSDCNVNLFCWTCLNDIEIIRNDETALQNRCMTKKRLLSSIVWDT